MLARLLEMFGWQPHQPPASIDELSPFSLASGSPFVLTSSGNSSKTAPLVGMKRPRSESTSNTRLTSSSLTPSCSATDIIADETGTVWRRRGAASNGTIVERAAAGEAFTALGADADHAEDNGEDGQIDVDLEVEEEEQGPEAAMVHDAQELLSVGAAEQAVHVVAPAESNFTEDAAARYNSAALQQAAVEGLALVRSVHSKSGFKGVYLLPSGKYKVQHSKSGSTNTLGQYDTAEEGALAYARCLNNNEAVVRKEAQPPPKMSAAASTSSASMTSENWSDAMVVGAAVLARYEGKKHEYPAKVAKVRTDGTFDVAYDDGDFESVTSYPSQQSSHALSNPL